MRFDEKEIDVKVICYLIFDSIKEGCTSIAAVLRRRPKGVTLISLCVLLLNFDRMQIYVCNRSF